MAAALKSYGVCLRESAFQFSRPNSSNYKRWNAKWRSPQAAVIPNFHLPVRSFEVKNRTSVEDIKSLRLITAIKTPYLPSGRFDLEAYDDLVNMQISDGAERVIVGGTTGEGQLMSWDEHIMLIGHTVNYFGSSIKGIGNTGSNSTREATHATEQGFAVGMHAALHINPYYGKTSVDGLVSQFVCLRESAIQFSRPNSPDSYQRRNAKWRSPQAAVIPNFHLPKRSFEVKNSYSIETCGGFKSWAQQDGNWNCRKMNRRTQNMQEKASLFNVEAKLSSGESTDTKATGFVELIKNDIKINEGSNPKPKRGCCGG